MGAGRRVVLGCERRRRTGRWYAGIGCGHQLRNELCSKMGSVGDYNHGHYGVRLTRDYVMCKVTLVKTLSVVRLNGFNPPSPPHPPLPTRLGDGEGMVG